MPISSFFIHPSAFKTCLWFLAKNKNADAKRGFRDRRKQTLFIEPANSAPSSTAPTAS